MSESVTVRPDEQVVTTRIETIVEVEPIRATPVAKSGFSVEQALYGLILLTALIARLLHLGRAQPLSVLEASQAWPAWLDAMNRQSDALLTAHSPLLYTAQRFFFWMTDGGSDAWARLFPALVGALVVLIPWGLRRQLGRRSALILAALLAFDPWLLTFSRLGDGAILSFATALLMWSALLHRDRLSPVSLRLTAVVAALFLTSGPLSWLLLPPLLLTAIVFRPVLPDDLRERTRLSLFFAGTLLAVCTGWLAYWQGWGALSSSLTVALSYLTTDAGYPLGWPFVRLLVDEPFLTILGLAGLAVMLWSMRRHEGDRRLAGVLAAWTVYGFALLLLPGRNPVSLLVPALPLLICAAWITDRILRFCLREVDWQDGSLIAVALGVLLITSFFLSAGYLSAQIVDGRMLLFYLILPLLVAFFVWWSGLITTVQVTLLLTTMTILLATISSAWSLALRSDLLRGNELFAEAPAPTVRLLSSDVADLSAIRVGDPGEADVFVVQVEPSLQPLVGWYLRFVRDLHFVDAVNSEQFDQNTLIIAASDTTLTLPVAAVGSDYPLTREWLPTQLDTWQTRLRWAFFRELRQLPSTQSVVLWVQED